MKKIKSYFLVGLMLCLLVNISALKVEANSNLNSDKKLYLKGKTLLYNNGAEFSEIVDIIEKSKESFSKLDNKFDRYYWQAQAQFSLAEIYVEQEENRKAAISFAKSNDLINKALKRNDTVSDAHRLLADSYMRQMDYKGALYAMTRGPKALKALKRAIKLDDKNYAVYNSFGMYYTNAPKIGGGDLNKAIKTLNKALKSEHNFDKFKAYIWLAEAYHKKNEDKKAIKNLKKALSIYPKTKYSPSQWGQQQLENLRKEN